MLLCWITCVCSHSFHMYLSLPLLMCVCVWGGGFWLPVPPLNVDLSLLQPITGFQALILRKTAFCQAVAYGKVNYNNSQNKKKNQKLFN